jgi:polyhydroxybutyrate depolymerase
MNTVLRLAIFTFLVLVNLPAAAQSGLDSFQFDGTQRTYYLHLPDRYDAESPAPLIIALHSSASSGRALAALSGLDAAADSSGYIITAYPNADGLQWAADANQTDLPDDVGFINALVNHLAESYTIDREQVYLAGFGNGGLMAYRMACETPEQFAGIAVVSALLWDDQRQNCAPESTAPVNLLVIRGSADGFYTSETHHYTTVFSTDEGPLILGVQDTMAFWAERQGCTPDGAVNPEGTSVTVFEACEGNTTLAYYEVPGGNGWPRQGNYRLNQFGADATGIMMRFFAHDDGWMVAPTTSSDETPRTYALYIPESYDPAVAMPLVLALHGRFGTGVGTASLTDMNQLAEKYGFIALYPDGINQEWNYIRDIPGYPTGPNDTQFLADLIADISQDVAVDPSRIYVAGFSNGGFMAERLACDAPDQYAAFATVSAAGFGGMPTVCAQPNPVAMLLIHGTDDTNIPWNGQAQTIGDRTIYVLYPVPETLAFWAQYIGCQPELEAEDLPPQGGSPGTQVRVLTVQGCPDGTGLQLYAVVGGGHNWPGKPGRIPVEIGGQVNTDIDAGDIIWQFFSQYTRQSD